MGIRSPMSGSYIRMRKPFIRKTTKRKTPFAALVVQVHVLAKLYNGQRAKRGQYIRKMAFCWNKNLIKIGVFIVQKEKIRQRE